MEKYGFDIIVFELHVISAILEGIKELMMI